MTRSQELTSTKILDSTYSLKLRIIVLPAGTEISLMHSLFSGYALGKLGEEMVPLEFVKLPPQLPVT